MQRLRFAFLLLCSSAPLAHAQTFDVASVRLSPPNHGFFTVSPPGPRFSARTIDLQGLITYAYGVDTNLIVVPSWANGTYFDVEAETDSADQLTREQLRPYLQNLLKDRFGLAFHWEQRTNSGYYLVTDTSGAKLKPSQGKASSAYFISGHMLIQNEPAEILAHMVHLTLRQPVEDHTGLTGKYDIDLKFAPDNATDSTAPTLPTALHEQLGLHLEPHKITQQFLVVDHAERDPGAN